MKTTLLRVVLVFVSLTGVFAIFAVVCPYDTAVAIYQRFGIELPESIKPPYLEYLTLLGAALSVVYGALCFIAGLWYRRYANIIGFLGWSLLFIGVVVLYHGVRLELAPWPFYADPIISLTGAILILWLNRAIRLEEKREARHRKAD